MRYFALVFVFGLTLISLDVRSQSLLTDLSDAERARAEEANQYYISKYTYTAKQSKLVRAYPDVLRNAKSFELRLFDLKLTAVTKSASPSDSGHYFIWRGYIPNPTISVEDFMTEFPSQKAAQSAYDAIFGATLTSSLFEYDELTNANFPINVGTELGALEQEKFNVGSRENTFYGISGKIKHADTGRTFHILPLEMGDGYHLLIEIDKSKRIRPAHAGVQNSPEVDRKQRDLEVFLEGLGEGPREQILRERNTQDLDAGGPE